MALLPNPRLSAQHFERPKFKTSEFGVRKGLWLRRHQPTRWEIQQFLKSTLLTGLGYGCLRCLVEQVGGSGGEKSWRTLELGHLWLRSFNTRSFWTTNSLLLKGFGCSSSGYVPSFGSMCLFGSGDKTFILGATEGQNYLLYACLSYMTCSFGLWSLKSNSVSY